MHMIFNSPTFYKNVKTDKSHILSGKTHTFQMNMLLILLNYDSINVFFYFPRAYCTKYTVLNKQNILKW